jgi:hypothetical protein
VIAAAILVLDAMLLPPVKNIRQLEAALHREWQQLSRQDIRRLTGGMRRRVEAVIHRQQLVARRL